MGENVQFENHSEKSQKIKYNIYVIQSVIDLDLSFFTFVHIHFQIHFLE